MPLGRLTCSPSARSWAGASRGRLRRRAEVMTLSRRPARSTRPARCQGTRSPPPLAWRPCAGARRGLRKARCGCRAIADAASEALGAGCPAHRAVGRIDVLVFFREGPVRNYDEARTQDVAAFVAFFHAMLDRGVHLPPSSFEAWFVSAAHDDEAVAHVLAALPAAARAAAPRFETLGAMTPPGHRRAPDAARRGAQPGGGALRPAAGYHLSDLGREMAELVARHLEANDIVRVVASPLERAQQTAAPIAASHGLPVQTDVRVMEAENYFEGRQGRDGTCSTPDWPRCSTRSRRHGASRTTTSRPGCSQPSTRRVVAPAGHEAVIVSHQLPIWTVRNKLEGRRLWHDPRKRECTLASLTSLAYEGDELESITYSEPAATLLARAAKKAGA